MSGTCVWIGQNCGELQTGPADLYESFEQSSGKFLGFEELWRVNFLSLCRYLSTQHAHLKASFIVTIW